MRHDLRRPSKFAGDVIPLLVVRTTPISQWKGLNSSPGGLGVSFTGSSLASRGVTGPKYVIEGTKNGLAQALGKSIPKSTGTT